MSTSHWETYIYLNTMNMNTMNTMNTMNIRPRVNALRNRMADEVFNAPAVPIASHDLSALIDDALHEYRSGILSLDQLIMHLQFYHNMMEDAV